MLDLAVTGPGLGMGPPVTGTGLLSRDRDLCGGRDLMLLPVEMLQPVRTVVAETWCCCLWKCCNLLEPVWWQRPGTASCGDVAPTRAKEQKGIASLQAPLEMLQAGS